MSVEIYDDLFDATELEQLKAWAALAYADSDWVSRRHFNDHRLSNEMANPKGQIHTEIKNFLLEKIKPLIGNVEIQFTFHHNHIPYGMHTDCGYGDETSDIYKQGIIPLDIKPSLSADVFTVIMNQTCNYTRSYLGRTDTIDGIEQLTDKAIDPSEFQRFWPSSEPDNLFGLSVAKAFRWQPGSMAIWNRKHLHASSDFKSRGVISKLGLMWVSQKEK